MYMSTQRLRPGERVVLGLSDNPYLQGNVRRRYETPAGLAWNVSHQVRIDAGGMAKLAHPVAEPIPLEELLQRIEPAAVASE